MKYQTKTRVVEAITFDELVEYGRSVTPSSHLMNGMPWSFKFRGHHVTHENDTCYLILGVGTDLRMTPGDMLIVGDHDELWTCMHDTFEADYEPATKQSSGVELIAAERKRQIEVEGWSPKLDDGHTKSELALAAACYAMSAGGYAIGKVPTIWPWDLRCWKPTPNNRVRELVKAGALIAAEIDRLRRKAARKDEP